VSDLAGLRIALVGPLPPPAGGMAGQTRQLAELLAAEGARVEVVRTNADYRPRGVGRVRGLRALFRLVPYVVALWRAAGRADLVHVMANSGWSWHLVAAPAVWIAHARRVPAIVNYRGGEAADFLERSAPLVRATLARAHALVVPSGFLDGVFARHGLRAQVIGNIVDLERFRPRAAGAAVAPSVLVARNLEAIYDIATALRAFERVRAALPAATMTVAGEGPERDALVRLRDALGLADAVEFCGRLDRDAMAQRYRMAGVVLNPSRVDNMPNSILEAMAARVPVVSTDVGGVRFVLRDGVTGLMVPPGEPDLMADALLAVLRDPARGQRLAAAAYADVQQYAWPRVRQRWIDAYAAARGTNAERACTV
jgi:glycosyltransferase involved in cell wall biosynthesis